MPGFEDGSLLGAIVVEIGQSLHRRAHEAAAGFHQRLMKPAELIGLQPDVAVEEEQIGRAGLLKQELTLLGHPAAGQMPFEPDPPSLGPQDPHHRRDRRLAPDRIGFGLIADDDREVGNALPRLAGEGHGQLGGPLERGDQNLDIGRRRLGGSGPVAGPPSGHSGSGT
nr:hypothetical protein [uncultured Aeromicrobium sp.]